MTVYIVDHEDGGSLGVFENLDDAMDLVESQRSPETVLWSRVSRLIWQTEGYFVTEYEVQE